MSSWNIINQNNKEALVYLNAGPLESLANAWLFSVIIHSRNGISQSHNANRRITESYRRPHPSAPLYTRQHVHTASPPPLISWKWEANSKALIHTVRGSDNGIDSLHTGRKCHASSKSEATQRKHSHCAKLNVICLNEYLCSLHFIITRLTLA